MKLNKDCIRDTLIYIEEHCIYYNDEKFGHRLHKVTFNEICEAVELSGYTQGDKYYTIQKLFEGNFIKGYVIPENSYDNFDYAYIKSLSLHGHELLDNIKVVPVWNKTKSILQKAGDFSLEIMSQIAGETMAAYTKSLMKLQ